MPPDLHTLEPNSLKQIYVSLAYCGTGGIKTSEEYGSRFHRALKKMYYLEKQINWIHCQITEKMSKKFNVKNCLIMQ